MQVPGKAHQMERQLPVALAGLPLAANTSSAAKRRPSIRPNIVVLEGQAFRASPPGLISPGLIRRHLALRRQKIFGRSRTTRHNFRDSRDRPEGDSARDRSRTPGRETRDDTPIMIVKDGGPVDPRPVVIRTDPARCIAGHRAAFRGQVPWATPASHQESR